MFFLYLNCWIHIKLQLGYLNVKPFYFLIRTIRIIMETCLSITAIFSFMLLFAFDCTLAVLIYLQSFICNFFLLTWNQLQTCQRVQQHLHHMLSSSLQAKPSSPEKQIQQSEGRMFRTSFQTLSSHCWMWEIWMPQKTSCFNILCRITLVPRGPH